MNSHAWVICESSGHWAAALRIAVARQAPAHSSILLREVRSLSEMDTQLDEQHFVLVLVELAPANLDHVLSWLAAFRQSRCGSRAVALLSRDCGRWFVGGGEAEVEDALFEAGVVGIARSPRRLAHILQLGEQLAERHKRDREARCDCQSLADWAWAQLPWQEAKRPVG
jgi:hypothetical protein